MKKAFVLCEDHSLDQYILRPVIEEIFREAGATCRVLMATNPRIQGYEDLKKPETINAVIANYRWQADAFFLVVDRDCKSQSRSAEVDHLKGVLDLGGKKGFFAIAVEELEVWALALHRKRLSMDFASVRAECDPKDSIFIPFARSQNWQNSPGRGRKDAMSGLRSQWAQLKAACPEVQSLADEVLAWVTSSS